MSKKAPTPSAVEEPVKAPSTLPETPAEALPVAGGHYTRNELGELVPYTPPQE